MGHTGLEPGSVSARKDKGLEESANGGAAKCAANADDSAPIDPDLASLIDAWPKLVETTKTRILGIVEGSLLNGRVTGT